MSNKTVPAHYARRRRDRIGADQSRVWARELNLGNPLAKAILLAVSNYMNEDGVAWPGVTTISRDTDITEETVRKRLAWLEEIGAIALMKRWRDENGVANYDGRGKQTSSEIRFLFDADTTLIEQRAAGHATTSSPQPRGGLSPNRSPQPHQGLSAEASPPPHGGLNDAGTQPAPCQPPTGDELDRVDQPANAAVSGNAPSLNSDSGDSPQAPLRGVDPVFDRFVDAYPIPLTDAEQSYALFAALTDQERDDAITGASGYKAMLADPRNRNRAVMDAHRWLRKRLWAGYVLQGKAAEENALHRWVEEGSDQFKAWEIYHRICGHSGFPAFAVTGSAPSRKAFVKREWPPVGREFIESDQATWKPAFEGSNQFGAWCKRLNEVPNARLQLKDCRDGDGGSFKRGLLVPQEWPPSKKQNGGEVDAGSGTEHAGHG